MRSLIEWTKDLIIDAVEWMVFTIGFLILILVVFSLAALVVWMVF